MARSSNAKDPLPSKQWVTGSIPVRGESLHLEPPSPATENPPSKSSRVKPIIPSMRMSRTPRTTASPRVRTPASPRESGTAERQWSQPAMPIGKAVERWLRDGKAQGHSETTIVDRRRTMDRFVWWLEHEAGLPLLLASLAPDTVRAFLAYLQGAGPRWGSDHPNASVAVRPATVNAYFRTLRAFINWCVAEEIVPAGALKNVKEPRIPKDQLAPFTDEQIRAMRHFISQTEQAARDQVIFLLLLDTGLRVSELCSLRIRDADRANNCLHVVGKGNKRRQVYLGQTVRRALWRYVESERRGAAPEEPLWIGQRGRAAGGPLQRRGVYRLISQAAAAAGVTEAHRGPHALRRTFAVNFLRNGGNLLDLQDLMGHEDLTVLREYVRLSETDLEDTHRHASPVDKLWRGK